MTKSIRIAVAPLAMLLVLSACKKSDAPADSREVELAPTPAGQPQLGDTAQAMAPRTAAAAPAPAPAKPAAKPAATAPAAKPSPAAPKTGTIASGAAIAATSGARVCTNTNKVGDQVKATTSEAVTGSNGAVVPAGATVTLRLTQAQRGENGKEGIKLAFEPVSVAFGGASYDVAGSVHVMNMETVRAQTTGDQAKKVAAGAAVGAIAGKLLGKKTSTTVAGAAVGAAAGGVIAAGTSDWNGCLAQGGAVHITLSSPLTVKTP